MDKDRGIGTRKTEMDMDTNRIMDRVTVADVRGQRDMDKEEGDRDKDRDRDKERGTGTGEHGDGHK